MKTNTLLAISKLSEVFNLDDQKKKKKRQRKSSGPKSISRNYPELHKILILLHTSEQSID